MYVVSSGSVECARAIIIVTLFPSLLSANTQVGIISFLWVARTKNFLEFLFNLEINQQWEVGGLFTAARR